MCLISSLDSILESCENKRGFSLISRVLGFCEVCGFLFLWASCYGNHHVPGWFLKHWCHAQTSNPTKMSRNLPVDHRWLAVELNKSSVPEIVCLIVFLGFDPYVAAISGPYGLIKALWWVSLPNPLPTSTLCAWGKLICGRYQGNAHP